MQSALEPLGYLLTWTVYGTFLQGDERWWRKTGKGSQSPQPILEQWHRNRLKHDVILLTIDHREVVQIEIRRHCDHREWRLWVANARSNHVHVVVSAPGSNGRIVRDQLKANCTRALRLFDRGFTDRPVWTVGGDWQCLDRDDDIEQGILYATEAQDRIERPRNM